MYRIILLALLAGCATQPQQQQQPSTMELGLELLRMARPRPIAPPLGLTCRTYRLGSYWKTDCD